MHCFHISAAEEQEMRTVEQIRVRWKFQSILEKIVSDYYLE